MEADGAGLAAHQAPHMASEWEAVMDPLRRAADDRRRSAAAAADACEWERGCARRRAAAGVRLKACEECEVQVQVEGEEEQDRKVVYSWRP